jgi:catechol 2,3-dioxygenase-like lactoylglutathione lyase family enzyme
MQKLALVAVVVGEYDEAIAFYVDVLGFELVEDTHDGKGKRWVVVRPRGGDTGLVLARAVSHAQRSHVGDQTGGRVFLFLDTDDIERDHARLTKAGVVFVEPPRHEPHGTVAVFQDLYGNRWDLVERKA